MTISYGDFARVDIRVGTIVAAEPFPEARRPAYKLSVDFGPEIGIKRSSAQLTTHYGCDALIGRQIAAVVNVAPRQIGKFMSEALVLGCQSALKFDPGSASNLDPCSALGQVCPGSEQEGPARSGATAASLA
jgi:tRNA-binding protein